jgi:hypothetical protein
LRREGGVWFARHHLLALEAKVVHRSQSLALALDEVGGLAE